MSCSKCQRSFPETARGQKQLRAHCRYHEGEKAYVCMSDEFVPGTQAGCGKSYVKKTTLRGHWTREKACHQGLIMLSSDLPEKLLSGDPPPRSRQAIDEAQPSSHQRREPEVTAKSGTITESRSRPKSVAKRMKRIKARLKKTEEQINYQDAGMKQAQATCTSLQEQFKLAIANQNKGFKEIKAMISRLEARLAISAASHPATPEALSWTRQPPPTRRANAGANRPLPYPNGFHEQSWPNNLALHDPQSSVNIVRPLQQGLLSHSTPPSVEAGANQSSALYQLGSRGENIDASSNISQQYNGTEIVKGVPYSSTFEVPRGGLSI
ncbi:uncharacterized protein VDAG_05213 [Verticillium dahliae VdLs.17]|uniref:C2H2-type domain-containing protein n=1 Tax=Verticillium dahliae (strain VdLs.17 / ATCC MYA-4575 / FGSC 10137) TaxID=498257 RepID=G2X4Y1_VERDV|nr:uncharacterized protein VDAG_05213 [Verticillium dahliae VdLs.17]EGY23775.1 hypothetical protein VDAG_05213 [Verticillium dahliae VdLs.17]